MQNLHSIPIGPPPKSHTMPTHGTCVSQSSTQTILSLKRSSDPKSSCSPPWSLQTIGKNESIFNSATSVGNSPDNTNLACNTRMEGQKVVLRVRNPAHQYADYAEAGSILKPNITNPAMIAFRPENLWKKSNLKIGFVHISNALFALSHTSPTARTAEAVTMRFNKQEDVNPSQTNLSLHKHPSNNKLDRPIQYSLQDIRPSHKGPTTPSIHAPEDRTHSRTSNQMLLPDPLISNLDINLPYE